ncbi:MAG TPA: DUF885 domain-containing protein [Bryobacteraceae bacterium]|jgi:uncharacterized protein (DUF885 family)|nr:DUF885 domain-containing protein [Bryobacteraceae bacterium]
MAPLSRRELLIAGAAVISVPLSKAQNTPATPNIDDFFRDLTADWVRHDPSLATRSNYFSGDEQDRLARQLTPRTVEWRRDRIARARKALADVRRLQRGHLTDLQRISAQLLAWQMDIIVDEEPYLDYEYPLQQMNGANVNLVETLTVSYPLTNERDAENYLVVLAQAATRLDEATSEARRLAAKKVAPPRFILQATIRQMQGFVDSSPAQNPFVTSFAEKLSAMKSLPDARRDVLRSEAEKIVAAQIYPAWKRGIALLESQMAGAADDAGLWRLKDGDDAYAYNLRRYTTTKLSAEEIHQIGLDHVASLEAQMDRLLRRINRPQGTVKARIEKLSRDMQYPNPASEASREQIMRDIDGILRDAEKRAALLFDIRPKTPVVARPFPAFRENNAAANYNGPPPDGSRPAVFQYPRRIDKMTKFGLRSTVYHETVPGHHFQIALEAENQDLPRFRQIRAFGNISAFNEGWGLYAERLAAESGWYGDDVEGLLGQLDSELFRARRLVVDTGLHAKHWTRQQGIDYGIEASEVERYAVYPGQACSYMMGELKILECRDRAKKALGAKFSLRQFHNKVLTTGTVPLEMLDQQVDAWVKSQG